MNLTHWYLKLTNFIGFSKQTRSIRSKVKGTMLGAGVTHQQKKLVTHTTLHHSQSALQTLVPWQFFILAAFFLLVVLGLIFQTLSTVIVIMALLSLIYFIDALFNLLIIIKHLYFPPEISFTKSHLLKIERANYLSIPSWSPCIKNQRFCPLFCSQLNISIGLRRSSRLFC